MRVLVLGGAGFIGSHTCVALAEKGHAPVVVDNFMNSSPIAIERVEQILDAHIPTYECDVRDSERLAGFIRGQAIDSVIHFAALKVVGESLRDPLAYFDNNISGTIAVLMAMRQSGVRDLVFSSSANVYGCDSSVPVREDAPLIARNPYGRTKLVVEQLIGDMSAADPGFGAMLLRYFNPIGAHASGLIGEDSRGVPNNLMPCMAQVALGRRNRLQVFGGDWPTRDGTGVRDYIHVMDLARAHVDAVEALANGQRGTTALNLGTGRSTTVLELVQSFSRASGREIPCEIVGRRAGDLAELCADPTLARERLGWVAQHDVQRMCEDAWRWQVMNPTGYV